MKCLFFFLLLLQRSVVHVGSEYKSSSRDAFVFLWRWNVEQGEFQRVTSHKEIWCLQRNMERLRKHTDAKHKMHNSVFYPPPWRLAEEESGNRNCRKKETQAL